MPVKAVKIEPIEQFLSITLDGELSPQARSDAVAGFANQRLGEALEANRGAVGSETAYEQYVDGHRGAPLRSVNPDKGVIVFEFELLQDVLGWIMATLVERSPRRSGKYRNSHRLFADGREIALTKDVSPSVEYSFVNTVPYARKLELGRTESGRDFLVSVPNYIYLRTAREARARFSNIARISFTFRGIAGSRMITGRAGNKSRLRHPAITVRMN